MTRKIARPGPGQPALLSPAFQPKTPEPVTITAQPVEVSPTVAVATVGLTREDSKRVAMLLASSQAANTRRNYAKEYQAFSSWCAERGLEALPATPDTVAAYLAHLAAAGKMVSTIRGARAGIADAHRQAGHENAASHAGVLLVVAGMARLDLRPQTQARPLTAEALAAIRATACTPRRCGGRWAARLESAPDAERRGRLDIAIASTLRDALLRVSEAAALRWGDVELVADGTARVLVTRSKSDPEGKGAALFLGPFAVLDLLAIRPDAAVIDAESSVFGLSASQLGRRIRRAAQAAGLGDGYSGHSGRVGMAQDLSASGVQLPALMQAGRWKSSAMPARYTERQAADRGAVAKYYRGGRGGTEAGSQQDL